ncbi:hypothetical protein [Bradyrhizobium sp. Gha]|uniref:hypothetical protein n=1 Tax=Bradyrhizobium sp. Gha TaxID=1855318 RepID=UPI0008E6FD31|nr:hypothetical protein [Bradyrhizobium sp. Gha]SFI39779.1 hypothetical protein SAMN05216525_10864 [Bradyrhizobium sp. Gha]
MKILHEKGSQRKGAADNILAALLVPDSGASFHTLIVPGGSKNIANVGLSPGGGLSKRARRIAIEAHDFVQFNIHAEAGTEQVADFNASTLRWGFERSQQIAIWCEPGSSFYDNVGGWLVSAANAGSKFQTIINTTPSQAEAWRAAVDRWKGRNCEVRLFGPEGLQ